MGYDDEDAVVTRQVAERGGRSVAERMEMDVHITEAQRWRHCTG